MVIPSCRSVWFNPCEVSIFQCCYSSLPEMPAWNRAESSEGKQRGWANPLPPRFTPTQDRRMSEATVLVALRECMSGRMTRKNFEPQIYDNPMMWPAMAGNR
jgi:hypothetical protein